MPMIEEQITESIQTGAPSIKYEQGRDQIASMPDVDAELYQMFLEALKEGQLPPGTDFKTYKDMMMQIGQQQVEPGQGIMQGDRAMAAYGGLMGADGRKQYGIGSWFQKKIMDPIKNNPVTAATIAALGVNQFGIPGTGGDGVDDNFGRGFIGDLFGKIPDSVKSAGKDIVLGKKVDADGNPVEGTRTGGLLSSLSKAAIPIIGGGIAGLFSQNQEEEDSISGGMGTGIGIQNVAKTANLLSPTEASAVGLRFSPELSTRKYSPAEMAVAYGNENIDPLATANLAQGGRIGFANGSKDEGFSGVHRAKRIWNNLPDDIQGGYKGFHDFFMGGDWEGVNMAQGGRIGYGDGGLTKYEISRLGKLGYNTKGGTVLEPFGGLNVLRDILKVNNYAQGGPTTPGGTGYNQPGYLGGRATTRPQFDEGGMLNLGGMEKDYRSEGGFVPIGEYEKKDDVPARLSVNEFVFTADAVRGAGEGDVDAGAKKLEGLMSVLEKKGKRSGAKEMFSVSERIGEVI